MRSDAVDLELFPLSFNLICFVIETPLSKPYDSMQVTCTRNLYEKNAHDQN